MASSSGGRVSASVFSLLVFSVLPSCLSTVEEVDCARHVDCGPGISCINSVCTDARDSGFADAGFADAGFVDAGFVDAGFVDAGFVDAGGFDAGGFDAGGFDAGGFDAGGFDAGDFDAGGFDGGVDAGPPGCSPATPCLASGYKFEQSPQCGLFCYYDEAHNIAVNGPGQGQNPAGFSQYALGQLTDGIRGNPDWIVNTGAGPGHEWVGWLSRDANIVFRFDEPRAFTTVIMGINNHGTGAVYAPSEIRVEFGDDGVLFDAPYVFRRSDGTLPLVPMGTRGDVALPVPAARGRSIRVTLVYSSPSAAWSMVDEFAFQ